MYSEGKSFQFMTIEINRSEAVIQNISRPSEQLRRAHLGQLKKVVDVSGPAITTLIDELGRKRFVGGSSQSHNISPADTVKER
uniref:Uncharacterized protein n=2 Tax=Caenorhabditis japonica TaxID=281687 RepID=A0A8R1EAM7_CAEJA